MKITELYTHRLSELFSSKPENYPQALFNLIKSICDYDEILLLCFRKDNPPKILNIGALLNKEEPNLEYYVTGPYLLDPFYQLFLKTETSHCEKLASLP